MGRTQEVKMRQGTKILITIIICSLLWFGITKYEVYKHENYHAEIYKAQGCDTKISYGFTSGFAKPVNCTPHNYEIDGHDVLHAVNVPLQTTNALLWLISFLLLFLVLKKYEVLK